jgi:t-SNARE complex subunit (syntaxin)
MSTEASASGAEFIDRLAGERAAVEGAITSVNSATTEIESLTEQLRTETDPADRQSIGDRMQAVVKRAQGEAMGAKQTLDRMKGEMNRLKTAGGPQAHIAETTYMALCNAFVESMKTHQKAKKTYSDVNKSLLMSLGKVLYSGLSDAEVERRVEENPAGFAQQAIIAGEVNHAAQMAYHEAQERAREIEMLTRSIMELHEMFRDLLSLVQHQSEQLESIELNVEQAGDHLRKGNEQVTKAIDYQRKARKKWCCIVIIVVVVLLVVAVPIGTIFGSG